MNDCVDDVYDVVYGEYDVGCVGVDCFVEVEGEVIGVFIYLECFFNGLVEEESGYDVVWCC